MTQQERRGRRIMSEADAEAHGQEAERARAGPHNEETVEGPVWCVVANMGADHPYGPGGAEIRRGTRHFAPGARLYVRHTMGWMGDLPDLEVVGRHRATHRYVRMVVDGALLERWRADLVYSPEVIRLLQPYWDGTVASQREAEELADIWARERAKQRATRSRVTSIALTRNSRGHVQLHPA